jgi:hypothetical protein
MAKSAAQSEKELQQDINAAIAGTEDEIFNDALGDPEDDNDGDTSLEDMGEGLEGDDLEDESDQGDEDEEQPEEVDEDEEEGNPEDTEADVIDEDEQRVAARQNEQEQPRDQRGRFDRNEPRIPPERLRQETEKRRAVEAERDELRQRQAVLEARFNDLNQRINAPAPRQPEAPLPKPDMFAEPERYEQWVIAQANEQAMRNVAGILAQRDEAQRQAFNARVDQSMASAARGPRGFEFTAAYQTLLQLDANNPQHRSVVQNIVYSQEPAEALFAWWEDNGGPEYRQQIADQLFPQERQAPRSGQRTVRGGPQHEQPRQVIRRPQQMRSLNSASGSSSHRVADPEMLDGSDDSIFDFATRR